MALLGVALIFASALVTLFTPFFRNTSLYGFRDWDPTSSYRYITVLSLVRYHELPWWHPFLCGGFPAWGYAEGATNLVSPYLPLYLAFPIQIAERLEVIFSTLAALIFTYLLAGRVTRSASLRALVAVAYAINGRWVMQAAEGHGWHLQYAWLPLAIFFFDVSLQEGRLRWALYAGIVLATIAYMGGIYPLPHAALALVLYASTFAVAQRSLRPFKSLAIAGLTGIGFAAPKLFPIIDLMRHYPRKIDSSEALGLGQLVTTLVDSRGTISHEPPVYMPIWGWHEYGIYVGVWVALAMLLAVLGPSERGRASSLRATGIVFLLLGCGAFHVYAPWTLLHELPTFSSQHVPSRFLMTAVLLLALSFAALAAKSLDHAILRHGWIDLLLWLPSTSWPRTSRRSASSRRRRSSPSAPLQSRRAPSFITRRSSRTRTRRTGSSLVRSSSSRCSRTPASFGATASRASSCRERLHARAPPTAARRTSLTAPGSSSGTARVTEWTPNTATVQYAGAAPGATLVYNMNYDSSWSANGSPAIAYESAVATRVTAGAGEVKFRYYPRTLNWGLFVWFLTTLAAFGGRRVERALRG